MVYLEIVTQEMRNFFFDYPLHHKFAHNTALVVN